MKFDMQFAQDASDVRLPVQEPEDSCVGYVQYMCWCALLQVKAKTADAVRADIMKGLQGKVVEILDDENPPSDLAFWKPISVHASKTIELLRFGWKPQRGGSSSGLD